jgi:uncharacterized damage-inducible protein DinB
MANRTEEFRELYAFNRWATQRILEAVAALPRDQCERDMGSSFRSIRDTLVHMMSAEYPIVFCRSRSASVPAS